MSFRRVGPNWCPMLEVIAVRYEGNISLLKLSDGTVVTRQFLLRQLAAGREAVTKPSLPHLSARIFVVRVGRAEFISVMPEGATGDDLGPLPVF